MSLLFITKLKTCMFLSFEYHSLIQDNVFHIFTLTAPLNDTWECSFLFRIIIIIIIIILYFRREGTKYILSIVKRKKKGIKCITP